MGPLRLYEVFNAMKLHWTTEGYDFKRFRGKVKNLNRFTLDKSPDCGMYFTLAKSYKVEKDFALMLIPLFLENEGLHVSSILMTEETKQKGIDWYRKIQTMPTFFARDCEKVVNHITDNGMSYRQFFHGTAVLDFLLYDHINIETFIILNDIFFFLRKNNKDSIIYKQMYDMKVRKYSEFIKVDVERYRDIFEKEVIKNNKRSRRNISKSNDAYNPDDIPF